MLGLELTPASGATSGGRRRRAAELASKHEELLVLLTTLRAASSESLRALYFAQPPRLMSRRSTYRTLTELVRVGVLARQRVLSQRIVYRLRSTALALSERVAARATDTTRKPLPSPEAEHAWLRSAIWAELARRGYRVGRGREELLALRRFLVDAQSLVVKRASDIEREAATLVLDALRKDPRLSPMFRSICRACGAVGPLNRALSACAQCRGDVDHVLSDRRFACARCGRRSDAPLDTPHERAGDDAHRCDGVAREADHLDFDVAWRATGEKREVILVVVDDPGRSVAAQLEELPLRIVGQPRLPIILRTTDSSSSFDARTKEWVTRGERHRELLRAFSDTPGRAAFHFRSTADVVDVRPELQLRLSPKRKEETHA